MRHLATCICTGLSGGAGIDTEYSGTLCYSMAKWGLKTYLSMCQEKLVLLVAGEHGPHESVRQASIGHQAAQVVQRAGPMHLQHTPYAVHTNPCQPTTLYHIVLNQSHQDR